MHDEALAWDSGSTSVKRTSTSQDETFATQRHTTCQDSQNTFEPECSGLLPMHSVQEAICGLLKSYDLTLDMSRYSLFDCEDITR